MGVPECWFNSLCGDLGTGMTCIELCPPDSIGRPCAFGGGVCTDEIGSAELGFGICL